MAEQQATTFTLSCSVSVVIRAPPTAIWARLTDADGFPRWNSTVTRIEGPIALGRKLAIRVPSSDRTFTPTVVELVPEQRMVWRDGMLPFFRGTRTFELTPEGTSTRFRMAERFEGMMMPMIRGSLPDFGPIFDRYAADLKQACEAG